MSTKKRTNFKKRYLSMLANARANAKNRKHGKKHHRSSSGSGKVGINASGLKRTLSNSAMAVVGALAARAAYGFAVKLAPDLDDKVRIAGGIVVPIIAGIALSGKLPLTMAVANGALGVAAADLLGDTIGDQLAADAPEVANAMVSGIGYAGKLVAPTLTPAQAAVVAAATTPALNDGTVTGWPRYDNLGEVDFLPEEVGSRLF